MDEDFSLEELEAEAASRSNVPEDFSLEELEAEAAARADRNTETGNKIKEASAKEEGFLDQFSPMKLFNSAVTMPARAIGGMADMVEGVVDEMPRGGMPSFADVPVAAYKAFAKNKTPEQQVLGIGRGLAQTAAGLPTLGLASGLGGTAYDYANELIGNTAPRSAAEYGATLRDETIAGAVPVGMAAALKKVAPTAGKLASDIRKQQAGLGSSAAERASTKQGGLNYVADEAGNIVPKTDLEQAFQRLDEKGMFKGGDTNKLLVDIEKQLGRKEVLRPDGSTGSINPNGLVPTVNKLVEEADIALNKAGTPPPLEFNNANAFVEDLSKLHAEEVAPAIKKLADIKAEIAKTPQTLSSFQKQKIARYGSAEYNLNRTDSVAQELNKAIAKDFKEAIERGVDIAGVDPARAGAIKRLNNEMADLYEVLPEIEKARATKSGKSLFDKIADVSGARLFSKGALPILSSDTVQRGIGRGLQGIGENRSITPLNSIGIGSSLASSEPPLMLPPEPSPKGISGFGGGGPTMGPPPMPLGASAAMDAQAGNLPLPRDPKAVTPAYVATFLDRSGNDPMAVELAKQLADGIKSGNRFKIEAIMEGMTMAFPTAFEDGWGVGGRIRNKVGQDEYLQHLRRLKENGRASEAQILKQEVAFRTPNDQRVLPGTSLPPKNHVHLKSRIDTGNGASYQY